MNKEDNKKRVAREHEALDRYKKSLGESGECLDNETLTDLLADLRHLAARAELDFASALRMSEMHFEAEAQEPW